MAGYDPNADAKDEIRRRSLDYSLRGKLDIQSALRADIRQKG